VKEANWYTCDDYRAMLEYLQRRKRHRPSRRKLCLFACACARRVWHLFPDESCRRAIKLAEDYVDGIGAVGELTRMLEEVKGIGAFAKGRVATATVHWAAAILVDPKLRYPEYAARQAAHYAEQALRDERWLRGCRVEGSKTGAVERVWLCDLLGDPFKPRAVDPSCLMLSVTSVARAVYDGRRFEDMPVLADALEEAGCTNADILRHCRGPGPHVRGCWALDLILGKS
jgi:hypothetical protein